jgi:hypothetical protein
MATLTLLVEDQLLQQSYHLARQQGTSLETLLNAYLEQYSHRPDNYHRATTRLLELAKESGAGSGERRWTREELYERG